MAIANIYNSNNEKIGTTFYRSCNDGIEYLFDEDGKIIKYKYTDKFKSIKKSTIVTYICNI